MAEKILKITIIIPCVFYISEEYKSNILSQWKALIYSGTWSGCSNTCVCA